MSAYRHANNTVAAHNAVAVTPSDTTHFPSTRAIYVGVTGNISVIMTDIDLSATADATAAQAADVIFLNVSAGTVLPIQVNRILSTGTTSTNILALY
jgi:hypothetical protein